MDKSLTRPINLAIADGEETYRSIACNPLAANPPANVVNKRDSIESECPSSTHVDASKASQTSSKTGTMRKKCKMEKFQWNLQEAPILPLNYPLERTSVFVPETTSSCVSERVSSALRELSIEASFDNKTAKATCVTKDGVDFRVYLYRGRSQDYSHGIIAEVQRRFGNSIHFYKDARAILDAAVNKKPASKNCHSRPALSTADEGNLHTPDAKSSLKFVSNLLNSNSALDAQYLALQTLDFLTDPTKVEPMTARTVSKELMRSDNDIGKKVFSIILVENNKNGLETSNDIFDLRPIAMGILSNVLSMVPANHIPDDALQHLLPFLQKELLNADNSPRKAHIASKCVEHLIQDRDDYGRFFKPALVTAAQVGHSKHVLLMKEAELCLQKIGC